LVIEVNDVCCDHYDVAMNEGYILVRSLASDFSTVLLLAGLKSSVYTMRSHRTSRIIAVDRSNRYHWPNLSFRLAERTSITGRSLFSSFVECVLRFGLPASSSAKILIPI